MRPAANFGRGKQTPAAALRDTGPSPFRHTPRGFSAQDTYPHHPASLGAPSYCSGLRARRDAPATGEAISMNPVLAVEAGHRGRRAGSDATSTVAADRTVDSRAQQTALLHNPRDQTKRAEKTAPRTVDEDGCPNQRNDQHDSCRSGMQRKQTERVGNAYQVDARHYHSSNKHGKGCDTGGIGQPERRSPFWDRGTTDEALQQSQRADPATDSLVGDPPHHEEEDQHNDRQQCRRHGSSGWQCNGKEETRQNQSQGGDRIRLNPHGRELCEHESEHQYPADQERKADSSLRSAATQQNCGNHNNSQPQDRPDDKSRGELWNQCAHSFSEPTSAVSEIALSSPVMAHTDADDRLTATANVQEDAKEEP